MSLVFKQVFLIILWVSCLLWLGLGAPALVSKADTVMVALGFLTAVLAGVGLIGFGYKFFNLKGK